MTDIVIFDIVFFRGGTIQTTHSGERLIAMDSVSITGVYSLRKGESISVQIGDNAVRCCYNPHPTRTFFGIVMQSGVRTSYAPESCSE